MTSFVPDSSLLYCSSSRDTSLVLWFESFDDSPFRRCVISSAVGIFLFNFSRLKIYILVKARKMSPSRKDTKMSNMTSLMQLPFGECLMFRTHCNGKGRIWVSRFCPFLNFFKFTFDLI